MPLKPEEIRNLGADEIKTKYNALLESLFKLNQQAKIGKLEKPDQIRQMKKDIARIMTIMTEKDIRI
ncbi:MAG TPA: 50S ribosomal protein L29 [Candidatus Omnitrophota bacterium]|nr:50S ribosomal protein L29 [Candidatus Omnitrophota bacterium]MDD5269700.1 50S ribosomal protein L29 [Candidatus Omnitrophota bacterium]MDD5738067.1 50S ribosomal protein L29 [Candidatus Omnitrophota bacterium]HPN66931.1 50S ribosomal protein L29 [Candidatus Omnitrophota bacterium]HRZ66619.1 50S ribosomal protein L29 [Candidatus Omnitrophota bacterium]